MAKPALNHVGILTPAATEDTDAFDAFRRELRRLGYVVGRDIYLDYGFADGDNANLDPRADDLLAIANLALIVADGTAALGVVYGKKPAMRIVQAVGGTAVPAADHPSLSGFHLRVHDMCLAQLVKLLAVRPQPTNVTVLHDSTNTAVEDPIPALRAALPDGGVGMTVIDAKRPDELVTNLRGNVVGSFMLIPNGMFWNNRSTIAKIVDDANVPAIYPEREYKNEHRNHKDRVIVHGHNIPNTFRWAARQVVWLLEHPRDTLPPAASREADKDED